MALTKRLNGKVYAFSNVYFREFEAQTRAKQLRSQGKLARVTSERDGNIRRGGNVERITYSVWVRDR